MLLGDNQKIIQRELFCKRIQLFSVCLGNNDSSQRFSQISHNSEAGIKVFDYSDNS